MKRTRLTREQSREQTQHRLLDSAQAVFVKKGFTATSVEDIVEAAGYTRGAFYSNFRGKTEFFLDLLRRDHETMREGLDDIFEERTTREDMEARVLTYYSHLAQEDKCFLLWIEAKLLAARDARFRTRFNAFRREKLDQLAAYIREFAAKVGTPLPLPAEILAMGLMGLCEGMQFLCTVDPQSITSEHTEAVLAEFFARVVFQRGAGVSFNKEPEQ